MSAPDSCCFETGFGPCGSRRLGDDAHPQATLGRLYRRYYVERGQVPPLDEVSLGLAVLHATERASVAVDDRFCADHAPAVETRLRYELAQEIDVPEMGAWLHSPEADAVAHAQPRLPDLDLVSEMEIEPVDVHDLPELGHDGLAA